MSLKSPVHCVSDIFPLYHVYLFWIYCSLYHRTNQICLMMSLTMMGLTPGPLVRALLIFALNNLLVVLETLLVLFVAWGPVFLS